MLRNPTLYLKTRDHATYPSIFWTYLYKPEWQTDDVSISGETPLAGRAPRVPDWS